MFTKFTLSRLLFLSVPIVPSLSCFHSWWHFLGAESDIVGEHAAYNGGPGMTDERAIPRAPNIVIILADDVGIGDITAYDSTAPVPTPNIDALAAAGTLLQDAHAQSLCAPSRASLLAGRHPNDVEWNYGFGSSIKASIQSNAHHFLSAPAVK